MKQNFDLVKFIKPEKKTLLVLALIIVWLMALCFWPPYILCILLLLYPLIRYLYSDDPNDPEPNKDLKTASFYAFIILYIIVSAVYLYPQNVLGYLSITNNFGNNNYIHEVVIVVMVISGWLAIILGHKKGGVTSAVIISVIYIANHIMNRIRGRFIGIDDFSYFNTAATYGKEYNLFTWQELLYIAVVTALTILYIKAINRLSFKKVDHPKSSKVLVLSTILATVMLRTFCVVYTPEPITYFINSCTKSLTNMNTAELDRYAKDYSLTSTIENKPNVIVILNEAYADLEHTFEDSSLSAHYDGLNTIRKDSIISGFMYCDEIGGGTINSEFSVLTGISTNVTATGGYLYQTYSGQEIISIPTILQQAGYYTIGINSATMQGYNRENAWKMYNFDRILSKEDFSVTEQARTVGMDDHELYDVALRNIQEVKGPTFQYLVTIQNHGPYESRKFGSDIEEYLYFQGYSTDQLAKFVGELKEIDEPTIVMFFGDHTPSLNRNNDETSDEKLLHQTPFFIWANYNTGYGHGEAELTTPNYLGVFLCRTMGISNEWYNDLGMLYGEYPVLAFTDNETAENVTKDFYLSDSASEKYKTYVYSCLEMLLK